MTDNTKFQIIENLLQEFEKKTGMSREEVEMELLKFITEKNNCSIFQENSSVEGCNNASDYDMDNYPHFSLCKNIQKYTLRVTLHGIKPAIYRKVTVPTNITLRHLSELLLPLMGWEDYHMNQFRKGYDVYSPAYQREFDFPSWGETRNFNQEDYTLSDILSEKGKTIEWEYDFGDSWCHDIRLSSIGEYSEGEPLISFVQGERACPPEDCGGVWGYEELLQIYEKKKSGKRLSVDEREHLSYYDIDDPDFFDSSFAHELCKNFCE